MTEPDRPALDDPSSREATASFLMRLRAAGVRDLDVLRAVEATPRHLFVPRRYRDLAFRELRLPLPCGQSMPDAVFAARLAEATRCAPRHRLLEIGAGSGYCTAIFARLSGEVLAVERYRSLVVEAQARLDDLGMSNVELRWGDGVAIAEEEAARGFDRIVVHALVDAAALARLLAALAPGGALIVGEIDEGRRRLARYEARGQGAPPRREILCAARLRPVETGVARAL